MGKAVDRIRCLHVPFYTAFAWIVTHTLLIFILALDLTTAKVSQLAIDAGLLEHE